MIDKIIDFIRWLNEDDGFLIISHSDADGALSAYIISKILDNLEKKYDVVFSSISRKKSVLENVYDKNVIVLDLTIDEIENHLQRNNFWVIDHHKPIYLENSINIFQNLGGIGSASIICFLIAKIFEGIYQKKIVDNKIGILAAISDGNLIDCLPILRMTIPQDELEVYIGRGVLFGIFSIYSTLFDWIGTDPIKAKEFYEALKRNDNLDIISTLVRTLEDLQFEKAIEQNMKILKKGLKYLEIRKSNKIFENEKIAIYKIRKRDAFLSRFIVDFIRNVMPEKEIVGVLSESKGYCTVSLRSNKVNLLDKIHNISKFCKRFGGHSKAVSFTFEKEKLKEILKILGEKI